MAVKLWGRNMTIKKLFSFFLAFMIICQAAILTNADETVPPTGLNDMPIAAPMESNNTAVENGCRTLDGKSPLLGSDRKLQSSGAAFLYEINTDTVVYAWNADERMIPASLVKIMTALIAVEKGNINDVITVTEEALSSLSKSFHTLNLIPGEMFTLEQLLNGMMVGSANDAAVLIADHIGNSQAEFVAMMNQRAKEIGCTGTNFVNATGLDDPDQYSTARDIAKIVMEAQKNELFKKFFGATVFTLPASGDREEDRMESSNYLMLPGMLNYYDKRVTGGRTGITENRTRCLAVTAESESSDLRYIGVILEAMPTFKDEESYRIARYGNYEDMKDLLNLGFDGNRVLEIFRPEQIVRQYSVNNGECQLAAGVMENAITILPDSVTMADLSLRYLANMDALTAPISAGDQITKVELWYGGVCLAQLPLIAMNNVDVISADEEKPIIANTEGFTTALIVIGIIFGVALSIAVIMYAIRLTLRARKRAQHRRRRQSRRRSK